MQHGDASAGAAPSSRLDPYLIDLVLSRLLFLTAEDLGHLASSSRSAMKSVWLACTRQLCDRAVSVMHYQHDHQGEQGGNLHADVGWTETLLQRWTQWYSLLGCYDRIAGWFSSSVVQAVDSKGVLLHVAQFGPKIRFAGHSSSESLVSHSMQRKHFDGYFLWRMCAEEQFQTVIVQSVWRSSIDDSTEFWLCTPHEEDFVGFQRHISQHCQLLPLDDLTATLFLTKTLKDEPGLPPELSARLERHASVDYAYRQLRTPYRYSRGCFSRGLWVRGRYVEVSAPLHVGPAEHSSSGGDLWDSLPNELLQLVLEMAPDTLLGDTSKRLFHRTLRVVERSWVDAAKRRISCTKSPPVPGRRYRSQQPALDRVYRWCERRHMETPSVSPPSSWNTPLIDEGQWLDVRDNHGIWHPAVMLYRTSRGFRVRWLGWSRHMEESLTWTNSSSRCAVLHSHSYGWGLPIRFHTYAILVPSCVCGVCRCEVVSVRNIYRCPDRKAVQVELKRLTTGGTIRIWQHPDRGTLMPLTDQTAELVLQRHMRQEPYFGVAPSPIVCPTQVSE